MEKTNSLHFVQVDVFTSRRFGGNQLAVFLNGNDLDGELMQSIAREMNYSESTFIQTARQKEATYRVRIFMPHRELPFAGHPVIGTSYVLAREGLLSDGLRTTSTVLDLEIGLISVNFRNMSRDEGYAQMTQPLPEFGEVLEDREGLAAALSLSPNDLVQDGPPQVVSCGIPFLYVPVKSLGAIQSIQWNAPMLKAMLSRVKAHGVFVLTRECVERGSTVHSRMFEPYAVIEDPATGSASGPLGAYLLRHGLVEPAPTVRMISEQGYEVHRPSKIEIEIDREGEEFTGVRVGGNIVVAGEGVIFL